MFIRKCFNTVLLLTAPLLVLSQSYTFTGIVPGVPGPHIVRKISTVAYNQTIGGEYLTILGKGHSSIVNPFIIVEGFDPLGDQDFETHISLYSKFLYNKQSFISNLNSQGYDVVILDFDKANDYIQHNAMLLAELIRTLYAAPGMTSDNAIVMGYSMGGLVARYALTWMESQGINHHTKLYISHDTPHRGANIPLGLQELFDDIIKQTTFVWLADLLFIKPIENSMPASKQMLIYHHSLSEDGVALPATEKIQFFKELYALSPTTNGYPSRPAKIAISNGNYSGIKPNIAIGDPLLKFDYWRSNGSVYLEWPLSGAACGYYNFSGCRYTYPYDNISFDVKVGFPQDGALESFRIHTYGKTEIGMTQQKAFLSGEGSQTFSSSNISFDVAPGSSSSNYLDNMYQAFTTSLGITVQYSNSVCFIPTVSALDLDIDPFSVFDPNNAQCLTVFDYIFANQFSNEDHFSFNSDAITFLLSKLENPIKKNIKRPFIEKYGLIGPWDILAGSKLDIIANTQIYNTSEIVMKAGSTNYLTAGESITLTPLFTAELGSTLELSIATMCDPLPSFNPHFSRILLKSGIASDISTGMSQEQLHVQYSSNAIDSVFSPCNLPLNTREIDSALNALIIINPNPTSAVIQISFSEVISPNSLIVSVYTPQAQKIMTIPIDINGITTIDLTSIQPGILTLKFDFNNGAYIFEKKVIKN